MYHFSEILIKRSQAHRILSRKNLLLGIEMLVGILVVLGLVRSPTNLVLADSILCNGGNFCDGTENSDTMVGDNVANTIAGEGGNDNIAGKGGNDVLLGQTGDDVISGGNNGDLVVGGRGADRLIGGDGNDRIFHNINQQGSDLLAPDGSKDIIDCGLGNDEAWINVSVDHDIAGGCEIIHAG